MLVHQESTDFRLYQVTAISYFPKLILLVFLVRIGPHRLRTPKEAAHYINEIEANKRFKTSENLQKIVRAFILSTDIRRNKFEKN
jgi:hypothetical protein